MLEHCKEDKIQSIIMDEILQSVCTLAQDRYGNYVIQHVLEHGKPHEHAAEKLARQIVQMSQLLQMLLRNVYNLEVQLSDRF